MRWLVGRRLVSSSSYRDHMMMIFCWCEWVRSEYRLLESQIYDMGTKPSSAREQRARFPLVDSGLRSPIRHKSARFIHLLLLLLTYLLAGLAGWLTEHWIRTRTGASVGGGSGASAHFEFFFLWTIEASNSDRSEKGYGSKHEALLMITYNVLYTQRTFEFDST